MILYSYYRSSAAYRVRIALALKGVQHTIEAINLVEGQQSSPAYRKLNPQGLVPALALNNGEIVSQSTAILEWLEETQTHKPLYPDDALERARIRALTQHIACDIHPLNNLRVLRYLRGELSAGEDAVSAWYAHWLREGFSAVEEALRQMDTPYSMGERPGMLEVYLVPQMFNAKRFNIDISDFSAITSLDERCLELDAFNQTHPALQPDSSG